MSIIRLIISLFYSDVLFAMFKVSNVLTAGLSAIISVVVQTISSFSIIVAFALEIGYLILTNEKDPLYTYRKIIMGSGIIANMIMKWVEEVKQTNIDAKIAVLNKKIEDLEAADRVERVAREAGDLAERVAREAAIQSERDAREAAIQSKRVASEAAFQSERDAREAADIKIQTELRDYQNDISGHTHYSRVLDLLLQSDEE